MLKKSLLAFLFFIFSSITLNAQDNLFARFTTKENQEKTYRNLIYYTINNNLAHALNDVTEVKWEEAFGALELLLYRTPQIDRQIEEVFKTIQIRSKSFQRSLLELAYTNYPSVYLTQTNALLHKTDDAKVFAMCAEYILQSHSDSLTLETIEEAMMRNFTDNSDNPILTMLSEHINQIKYSPSPIIQNKYFTDILSKNFLPGQIIMYSFQRKDRNHPGLVIIRNAEGKYIRDTENKVFNVPQLARSITNLPGYLTNGNTPQGIFKMFGFGVSSSMFIGPSPNIQMAMPVEINVQKFFNDTTIRDSVWSKDLYGNLLPVNLKSYLPLYNSYYAGLAGRTEIISHGTTINPEYYKGQPYYPLTPSQGCLCTKEIWDGKRIESDQKKLINALLLAGGANGYCVVIELDDNKSPVTLDEIIPHLLKAESLK